MSGLRVRGIRALCFGPWRSPAGELALSGGLDVIVGPNEAGKSALAALLRAALHGFRPASRERYPWVPLGEERADLEVDLELGGQTLQVRRRLLSQPQGSVRRGGGVELLRNAPLPEAAHLPEELYGSVYALDLDSLTPPSGAAWTAIEERLLGGEVEPDLRPAAEVLAGLEADLAALGEARGRRRWGAIGRATDARDDLRQALAEARRHENRLHQLAAELAGVAAELARVEAEAASARAERSSWQQRVDTLTPLAAEAAAVERELDAALSRHAESTSRFAELSAGLLKEGARPTSLPAAGTLRALAGRLKEADRELELARRSPPPPATSRQPVLALALAAGGLAALLLLPGAAGVALTGVALALLALLAWLAGQGSPAPEAAAAGENLHRVRQEIAAALAAPGVAPQLAQGAGEELLERLAATADEGQRLLAAEAAAARARSALAALPARAGTAAAEGERCSTVLAALRSGASEEVRATESRSEQLTRVREALLDLRRQAAAEHDRLLAVSPIDRLTGELHTAEESLAGLHRRRERLAALREVVREAQRRHRERFEPAVLQRVAGFLSRLTHGRWQRLHTGSEPALDAPPELGVEGGGVILPLDRASRGTRDQLLLALRLAVAEELDAGGPRQPLILDEPLVNWDAGRRREGLALLASIATRRQVILLTCHPWLAAEAAEAGAHQVSLPPPPVRS